MNFNIELTSTPITSHAGLSFIGDKLNEAKLERHLASMGPRNTRSDRIADADLAKTMAVNTSAFNEDGKYKKLNQKK